MLALKCASQLCPCEIYTITISGVRTKTGHWEVSEDSTPGLPQIKNVNRSLIAVL